MADNLIYNILRIPKHSFHDGKYSTDCRGGQKSHEHLPPAVFQWLPPGGVLNVPQVCFLCSDSSAYKIQVQQHHGEWGEETGQSPHEVMGCPLDSVGDVEDIHPGEPVPHLHWCERVSADLPSLQSDCSLGWLFSHSNSLRPCMV